MHKVTEVVMKHRAVGARPHDPAIDLAPGGSRDRIMDRRAFLGTLSLSLLLLTPPAAEAQAGKMPRIGILLLPGKKERVR